MKIIKLCTTPSTNSFLKDMATKNTLSNFTVVVTDDQTSGRGQMETQWISEKGKNLIMSIFCRFKSLPITQQKYLNFAVSVSVFEAVSSFDVPKLAIKWPNDILSVHQKICGILIENQLKSNQIASSIIGIGLNVNQTVFPAEISNATSLKNIVNTSFSLDEILQLILEKLQHNINLLNTNQYQQLAQKYLANLYKKNVPSMFKTIDNKLFMGKIVGVASDGKLQIELEDETIAVFGVKEVSFA